MFNKTIFKQTLKSNMRLWFIITGILIAMSSLIIAIFNPATMEQMMNLMERLIEDPALLATIASNFSLLNVLAMNFYTGMGIILTLIYVIITSNALVCSHVDRGSMAYILSTPIKRTTVVITQAIYFVIALLLMYTLLTLSGMVTAQMFHGGVFTRAYTADVREVADFLNMDRSTVADDLTIIARNPEAVEIGAQARNIDIDVYIIYLDMLIAEQQATEAEEITPPIEETPEERAIREEMERIAEEMAEDMQNRFMDGVEAAAEILEMQATSLIFDLGLIKDDPIVLVAASEAAEMHPMQFVAIINMQLANEQVMQDAQVNFNIPDYIMLNVGVFLLMFATSGISFLASCLFNLTKNAMAIGAGIPIAFYLSKLWRL